MINQLRNKTMEHETSQNLIKVELTVKQLTSILINFDYLNKLAKERGKSLIAIKYSNDIEPFKKALNYTLAEDPRQFSAEECDLLYWANKFVNDPDAAKKYAIALNKSTDTTDKQPKADDRLTITEDEATAIDHMIYFHDMFKPDVLQVFRKVTKLQSQLAALVCTIQDLPLARLYDSATAPDISAQRLKRFNTTKVKKGALVVSA